jgi:hypothetical protein
MLPLKVRRTPGELPMEPQSCSEDYEQARAGSSTFDGLAGL